MIFSKPNKLILIGASTGGPGLIENIITSLNNMSLNGTIIIAQHMDRLHLESFGKRLNRISTHTVHLISQKTQLTQGVIYLLEDTATFQYEYNNFYIKEETLHKGYYHPTINELFFSASKLKNIDINAYLLSGIGADGAKGLLALKQAGHKTVAQDEESSIVYGMPKAALEMDAVQKVMSINEIIIEIKKEVR